jgi:hypothetical protein
MPRFSFFQKRKKSTKEDSPPPPYAEGDLILLEQAHASGIEQVSTLGTEIKATDTPQWIWTNAQCRAWIFAVCSKNLGLGVEESKIISEKFEGYGPNIYCLKFENWVDIFGSDNPSRAESVYSTILGLQDEEGAVPKTIRLQH